MATKTSDDRQMLARLDERTQQFARTLDFIAAENRELSNKMLLALEKHVSDDDTRFDRHDGRLRLLENWRWYILGAIAVVGFMIYLYFQFYPVKS